MNLTIPEAQVTAPTAQSVALPDISPVSFRFQWSSGVSWWFEAPMARGGTFDNTTKKGTLYHEGGLRFVNVANNTTLRMGGMRFIANGPKSFTFSAAVGEAELFAALGVARSVSAREDRLEVRFQRREVALHRLPEDRVVHAEVLVHDDVAQAA